MTDITDEYMRQMISTTRQYCIMILKAGSILPRLTIVSLPTRPASAIVSTTSRKASSSCCTQHYRK